MYKFKSYLQLSDRLSQIWLNKYTLILLLSFFKVFLFYNSICKELNIAKQFIISHCATIDLMYNNIMTKTPYYLNSMGSYLIEKSMEEAIKSILTLLSLLVTASEELMTFIIDFYLGTYTCLVVSTIDGTVDVATNTTEKLIKVVNSTVSTFANDLDDGLNEVSKIINKIISGFSKIKNFFKQLDSDDSYNEDDVTNNIKKVNLTIESLRHIYIPSSINEKLKELSADTPNFDTVKNDTKHLISKPFQSVKNDIKTINISKIIPDISTDNLYQKYETESNNSTFDGICSSNIPNIEKFFLEINKSLRTVTIILLIILVIGTCIMMIPEAWKEVKQWQKLDHLQKDIIEKYNEDHILMKNKEEYDTDINSLNHSVLNNNLEESFDVIESYQRCFNVWQTKIYDLLIFLFTFNKKNYSMLKKKKLYWIISYVISERAIFILSVGVLGIILSCFQLIILAVLKKHISNIPSSSNNLFNNSSQLDFLKKNLKIWTENTNQFINYTESNINEQIFGWVETSTSSINNTVATMIKGIDTTLADLFNGTLLYKPMTTVVKCVIEDKLYSIEKAMTWIHNKAHVTFPQINSTELVQQVKYTIRQNTSTTNTINNSTISNNNNQDLIIPNLWDEVQRLLSSILNSFHNTVILELIISGIITTLWVIQIPLAILIMLWRQSQIS